MDTRGLGGPASLRPLTAASIVANLAIARQVRVGDRQTNDKICIICTISIISIIIRDNVCNKAKNVKVTFFWILKKR